MAQGKQIAPAVNVLERKKELTARLAEARQTLSHGREALKEKLKLKTQLRRFITRKPKAMFLGSIATGLAMTLIFKRPRKEKKAPPKSAAHMVLGWALSLAKPAAKAWLVTRARKLAEQRLQGARTEGHPSAFRD